MTEPNRGNDRRMASRHTESLSDIRNAGSDRTTAITLFHKEKDLSLHEGEKNQKQKSTHVSLVWRCWVLGFGVMWCCAVVFPEERLDLLTACLQTVGRRYLLQQFHHSPLNSFHPILLSISGRQLSTSGSFPGFIKLNLAGWLAVWLVFPSFLFPFCGIVRLALAHRPAVRLP